MNGDKVLKGIKWISSSFEYLNVGVCDINKIIFIAIHKTEKKYPQ